MTTTDSPRSVGQAPTPAQVREQVAAVRQKVRDARVIGVRADGWTGPDVLDIDGTSFRVVLCRSPLHVREELLDLHDDAGLIVLTSVPEQELGGDVMARLAKRQLFDIDTWRLALDLFRARAVDPRVQRSRWLADALVEGAPPGGYSPVPSGVLDSDTVWDVLLRGRLGMSDGRPDGLALLRWADRPGAVERYTGLPVDFREGVRSRVQETGGVVALAMLDGLELAPGSEPVALGLACRVLFDPQASPELRDAAVRFERFHRQHSLPATAAQAWAEAAERVLVERESEEGWAAARSRADRADRLLRDLGAAPFLHLASWSPGGFEQRLARFAACLASATGDPVALPAMEDAARTVLNHRLARQQEGRRRRVEMASRLARWIHGLQASHPPTLADSVQAYCVDGSFVDLARLALLGGEQPPELGRVYVDLLARARERREAENERFARLLAEADAIPGIDDAAIVPVERVLDDIVAPLARTQPVLLLVMDGLSRPVYQELLDAIVEERWRLWRRPGAPAMAALAAIPTITEVSRTSLLCGRLTAGSAADEKRGFASHPGLLHASRARRPPVLFHKGDLLEPSGRALSSAVRQALATPDERVVGVVLNVVDDLLFKGDQIQPRWTLTTAPLLRELFEAARTSGRAVVLTSDHGHLLDDDTAFEGREAGERWREDDGRLSLGEVRVKGRRVLAHGRSSVVVPWSERLRYSPRRNGYHGGVTPQECVLPLAVLTFSLDDLSAFVEAPLAFPDWWFESAVTAEAHVTVVRPLPPPAAKARPLLDAIDAPPAAPPPVPVVRPVPWVDALIGSERYAEQKGLSAGRGLPSDEEVRRLLLALAEGGGRMRKRALAQRLGLPLFRLDGFVAAARRLLNVDGLAVLDVDDPSETVAVNVPLLVQQFELRG